MSNSIVFPVNAQVLIRARKEAGFSIEEVKKEHKNIELWESGEALPTYSKIKKLSEKYKKPSCYFLFPGPVADKEKLEKFRNLRKGRLPPKLIHLVNKAMKYQSDIRSIFQVLPNRHPHFSKIKVKLNDPEELARTTSSYMEKHLPDFLKGKEDRLLRMRRVVEAMGVFVFKDDFSIRHGTKSELSKEDGFCLYDKDFPVVMVSNNISKKRQLFTLFHELFHILVGEDSMLSIHDSYNEELQANVFASEFLVPKESLKLYLQEKDLGGVDLEREEVVKEIAKHYEVSRHVIVIKLNQIGSIDDQLKESFLTEFKKENKKYKSKGEGGNYYPTIKSYLSPRYFSTITDLYHSGKITPVDLGRHLSMKSRSAYVLVNKHAS